MNRQFYKIWIKYSTLGSCLLLAFAASVMLKYYFLPVEKNRYLFLFVIPALMMVYVCDRYKRNALLYIVLLAVVIAGIAISYAFDHNILKQMEEGIRWFLRYDGTKEAYNWQYGLSSLFLMCLVVTLISYLICQLGKWQYIVDGLILVFVGILTIWNMQLEKLGGICLAMYLLGELSKISYICWYNQRDGKRAEYTAAYLLPLFIALGLIMGILPYKETPIKWEGVKKAYVFVKEQVEKVKYELASLLDQAGDGIQNGLFVNSGENRLGGDLKTEDRDWMKVKVSNKTHDPVYMVGSYKAVYQDNKWKMAEDSSLPIKEQQLDYYELMYCLLRQKDLRYYDSILRQRRMEISYANIKTKAIFVPSKTKNVQNTDVTVDYRASGVQTNKINGYDTKYTCAFAEWNTQSSLMIQLMRGADTFSYENLDALPLGVFKTQAKIGSEKKTICAEEDHSIDLNSILAERAAYIKKQYTQLPDDFSKEISELAESVTADCKNNYDRLMALKRYLSQYTYTTSPGALPKGKELCSYFLFENQKGYCTYFATSLVMMGRSLGIPMRYVEGALLDYSKLDNKQHYIISNSKAHAWAEAYFEGVGWVIFEATPGYDELTISSWPTEEEVAAQKEESRKGKNVQELLIESKIEKPTELAVSKEEKQPISMGEVIGKGGMVLGILTTMVIFLLILWVFYIKWRYYSYYQRGNYEQRFSMLFYEMLGFLAQQGIRLQNNETLMSFEEKIRHHKGKEALDILEICRIYRGLRYGNYPVDYEGVVKAKEVCKKLLDECNAERGKIRTYWPFVKNQYESLKKYRLVRNKRENTK